MGKIWRISYKHYYGNRGNFWMKTIDIHNEDKFNREIKKLKDVEGTIEIFESTEKLSLETYISSIMRDNQLDNLLVVADEKSTLYSKFVEMLLKSEVVGDGEKSIDQKWRDSSGANGYSKNYLKTLINEWEFLKKSDDGLVKKFFAKYRTYLLNYANDSYEWYETLLQVYNYMDIKPVISTGWSYNTTLRKYVNESTLIKDLTENQKKNFFQAKKFVKELKAKEKKLKKKES